MAYILGQYAKNKNSSDDSTFATFITSGSAVRVTRNNDTGAIGASFSFQDECIKVNNGLSNSKYYYFHGKIKRQLSEQRFYVKLINYNATTSTQQYIKTVEVGGGNVNDWVDVEFIFSPYSSFDTIMFELDRTSSDYTVEVRYPIIIYEELSEINNIINSKIKYGVELIKLGVQSNAGFLMCINGEEIRVSRTGFYEMNNGLITAKFFSVVGAGIEVNQSALENEIASINTAWAVANSLPTVAQRQEAKAAIKCRCRFDQNKTRQIGSFILDYVYKE